MPARRSFTAVLLVSSLGFFAGCVAPTNSASNILDRVDAHRAEYESWPLEVKEAILDGRVVKGMTPAMVVVAKGEPYQKVDRGGGDEVWVYRTGSGDSGGSNLLRGSSITLGGSSIGGGGIYTQPPPIVLGGGGSPIGPNPGEEEVVFRNGRVTRGPGIK